MSLPPHIDLGVGFAAVTGSARLAMILVVVLLGLVAAFFAMSETAMTRMSRIKAIALDEDGRRGAKKLLRLMEDPERTLTPILLLVLVCHLLIGTLVGILIGDGGWLGIVIGLVVEAVGVFVFSESAPKTYAVKNPEKVSLFAAPVISAIGGFPPIRVLTQVLIWIANLLIPGSGSPIGPSTSEEELLALAGVAAEEDVIERGERQLIHSIIEFGDTVAREVMVARPDMVTVDARTSVSDTVEIALTAGYSRIPVHHGTVDDIAGLVYLKDIARAERDGKGDELVGSFVRAAKVMPESKRVSELLREMQRDRFHMAVVVDEHGGVAGLVTMEDLIEELVGEIVDEYDAEPIRIERSADGSALVAAATPIDEANDALGLEISEDDDWDTLGGYLLHRLGEIPEAGAHVDHAGKRLTVRSMAGNRIDLVHVMAMDPPDPDGED